MHDQPGSEEDDDRGPSRSQQRREALEILSLAERLVALTDAELDRLPLSAAIVAAVRDTRRIRQQIARKRQLGYLAKLMRREAETLEPVREALAHDRAAARREAAGLHRVERWRERLLEEGDDTLAEFIDAHPGADRQQLRQLVRRARGEREREAARPHAYRELFRTLRALLEE